MIRLRGAERQAEKLAKLNEEFEKGSAEEKDLSDKAAVMARQLAAATSPFAYIVVIVFFLHCQVTLTRMHNKIIAGT